MGFFQAVVKNFISKKDFVKALLEHTKSKCYALKSIIFKFKKAAFFVVLLRF
jgi:hypothetical protein